MEVWIVVCNSARGRTVEVTLGASSEGAACKQALRELEQDSPAEGWRVASVLEHRGWTLQTA